jgi:two-component sensor histidine kinase
VQQLCNHLKVVFSANQLQIQCDVTPPQLALDIEESIPLGIILNELVTNALKYGQINREGGLIKIQFTENTDGLCTLLFSDNGVGMPEGFEVKKSPTLGLRMVYELTRQLKGTIVYTALPEPTFTIVFPVKKV